ncbi:uncharacterized protein LOC118748383 [Rhagoletis pomonella]|uniref:uncharacterized protein LOC118748383 n=1 Tax=Rhagoletis pomonella TaxID=28610 RepID=UPI00177DDE73|nr:uncharacterized protein LOC118748383 [Rhagoletis pomonella]
MSLPATPLSPSSSSPSFSVTGKALQLQLSRPLPQLPTRKIYNPAFFFNETYQHEIANNYRDFKQRSRIPRRRRHTIYVPYRREAFYGVVSAKCSTKHALSDNKLFKKAAIMANHLSVVSSGNSVCNKPTNLNFPTPLRNPQLSQPGMEQRDCFELSIPKAFVHVFTAVYTTPRGRQTLCEDAPADDTYNATVRRIRQANDYKELKVLVERQLRWSANRKSAVTNNSSSNRRRVNSTKSSLRQKSAKGEGFASCKADKWATVGERKCENSSKLRTNNSADVNVDITYANGKWYDYIDDDEETDSNANDSVEKVKEKAVRRTHCNQSLRTKQATSNTPNSFWNAEIQRKPREVFCSRAASVVSSSNRGVRPQIDSHNKREHPLSKEDVAFLNSPAQFLQLACDYYEQGFLQHINYLQAIGKRNAARREQLKRATKRASSLQTSNSSNDETASAATSATNTPGNTPRLRSAEQIFRLTYLLRHIGRKRSFNIGISAKKAQSAAENGENNDRRRNNSCAIRVKIKPSATQASHYKTTNAAKQSTAVKCTATTLDGGCSMNDYLNANSPTTISSTTNTVATRANFHELIDHLMQLEISDIDESLPKITLTDCSAIDNNGVDETSAVVASTVTRATATATATTTTQTNDNAFAFEFNTIYNNSNNFSAYNALHSQVKKQKEQQQQEDQQQVLSSARRNGFTLRETKFGASALHSSLELPEEVYYSSEARPP